MLREDFLRPSGLTANALAKALRVPTPRINDIVRERRGVSADTAMRLARYFGGEAHSWLNLQAIYDLRLAEIASARQIQREIMPRRVRETPPVGGALLQHRAGAAPAILRALIEPQQPDVQQ